MTDEQKKRIEEEFGIPVDHSLCLKNYWIVSLSRESELPTDEELKQIHSFLEFIVRDFYTEGHQKVILAKKLSFDDGHNTTILKKEAGSWFFRKMTWYAGPDFAPSMTGKGYHPHNLIQVMDLARTMLHEVSPKWIKWKQLHPEIFPPNS